ncbi:GNAT family N-acetyltransferase [Rhizobium sp. SEMIA 4085]|uniref:GCN5-related N-acetyltransferase protein n=1 Tax=Rhizobium gallicum bv. gallicum R602sp TaxID=1041138 RepID=A0A0B4XAL8_9HYPH|nr:MULTISPECIES: GNAT family N-acetyltransferase [Rhizobium]AJD43658.1 GCN5-related N-acetyltransferase protein [Rhizobium gallicum bv. gallicum R602sp]NNH29232.1 GNAT family N-acetyltransferase [Rhizobium sp. SEMIA 4085]TDW34148.1 acetyltransferase (GNAT) family protein [Rhizobium azibense]
MAAKQIHTRSPIVIEYLESCRDWIPVCTSWSFGQWGCQANGSFEQTKHEFETSTKSSLPLTLVAVEDGRPAGMISLNESDFKGRPDLSPWLKSLYVHPFHRNKGIASLLIKRLEHEALRLGCERLYLTTEDAKGLYMKNDWLDIDRVRTPYGDAALMTKILLGARTG